MTSIRAPLVALLVIAGTPLMAEPTPAAMAAEVTDNVAMEYAECAAFFSIVNGAFLSSGKATQAAKFKETSDKAAMFSLMAAKQSRAEEMATKVTLARIEMNLKDMQKTIDNNYSNMSLLSNKYLTPCVEAMQDSAPLINRWTERIQGKYGKQSQR
nr:hypothetical protein [uncultured Albidiferax sp.]